jgi:hypothetical protein
LTKEVNLILNAFAYLLKRPIRVIEIFFLLLRYILWLIENKITGTLRFFFCNIFLWGGNPWFCIISWDTHLHTKW